MGGEQHVDEVWLLERQERFGSVQINSSTSTTPLDLQVLDKKEMDVSAVSACREMERRNISHVIYASKELAEIVGKR